MSETTLTLKFRGVESEMLEKIVNSGIFNTKSEAIRAAIVHYSLELGLVNKVGMWKEIQKYPKKKISEQELIKKIHRVKEATIR